MAQIFKAKILVSNTGRFSHEVTAPNLVYNTGDQNISGVKNFYFRPTVNGTGVLLIGEASSVVLPDTIVYTTGNQTISGNKNFVENVIVGDQNQDNLFVVSGNEITFGVNPTVNGTGIVYTQGNQTISGTKTFDVAPILSGNPFITGVNLSSYIRTGQTGDFYPRSNPSGYITNATLNNVVYTTGDQNISGIKNFISRPTVNGTGVLLSGEAASLPTTIVYTTGDQNISGVKNFYFRPTVNGTGVLLIGEASSVVLPDTIVYTTGNQTISGNKNFVENVIVGDQNQDNLFVVSGNEITFGVNPTVNGTGIVYTQGNQTISGTKTFDVAPILSGNPFITGVNLSSYITTGQTGAFYPRNNPSGYITGVDLSSYVTTGQTGNFYPRSNPSGYITGVDLSSYVTTGQTGNFYPRSNPSGYITGVDLSSYVTTGQTGNFYPRNNPSGFITGVDLSSYVTTGQTGSFYPRSNPSGYISSADLSSYALANQVVYKTGNQTIDGNKNFTSRPTVNGIGVLLTGEVIESSGAGGSIFITYVTPSGGVGNVGDYVYETPGEVRGNTALISCSTTTQNVLVDIYALQGRSRFKPKLYITGQQIPLTLVERQTDRPVFLVNDFGINLNNATSLRVDHEDGAYYSISITQDAPPQVLGAYFYGGYPTSPAQTELKAGDTFNFHVDTDVPIVSIEIDDFGAFNASTTSVTAGTSHNLTKAIANRGDSVQALGARVRVKKANGSFSAWFLTTSQGSTDGQYTVKLNNISPTISFSTIIYPATQGALKNTESATVLNTVSNYDTISYTSSQLDITSSTLYQSPKTVSRKSSGGTEYNVSSPNLTITAVRTANNKSASGSVLVKIANGTFTLTVSTNSGQRLRTGGNNGTSAQSYTVIISSTQELSIAPTLSVPTGGGTLGSFGGGPTSWSATLSNINDNLIKGPYTWGNISATNIAGTTVTIINSGGSYVIGGFLSRTVSLAAFANEVNINTSVLDYTKMTLSWVIKSLPNRRAVGTTATPDPDSWTINSLSVNPTIVRILDTAATQSSSQATNVTVEETV